MMGCGGLTVFVKKAKRGERIFLSLVESYRNEEGKPRQRHIEDIGYVDELEKEFPNPIEHFQGLASERTQAQKQKNRDSREEKLGPRLQLTAELPLNSTPLSLGYAPVKALLRELEFDRFWRRYERRSSREFSLRKIFLLLVTDRFLHPSSKRSAFLAKDELFEKTDFELHDIYRALPEFAEASSALQTHLHEAVQKMEGKHDDTGYYDVTNFYFEIPYEDEDIIRPDGTVVKGLRRRGVSKEHRKDPIVQMGLLMDSRGIPLAFHKYPGNGSEKIHMLPALRQIKRSFDLERVVVVADRGLNTSTNISFLAGENNDRQTCHDGYIFGQTVRGASQSFQEWMFSADGWAHTTETDRNGKAFAMKHKSRVTAVDLHPKNSEGRPCGKFKSYQKQVVFYSEKRARKDAGDRERAVAKARALIDSPMLFTRATSVGAAGYVKNLHFSKTTGEVVTGETLTLDEEKIRAEAAFDGYYAVVTSETRMTDLEIIAKYRGLWEIEESFGILKSEFRTRPVFVSRQEAVEAHLLICFTALVIMRLLERRLQEQFSVRQIRDAVTGMNCAYTEGGYYQVLFRNEVTDAIADVFHYPWRQKYLTKQEIRKILSST